MQSSLSLPRVYIVAQRAMAHEMVSDELRSEPVELVRVRDEAQYFELLDEIQAGCVLVDVSTNPSEELKLIASLKAKQSSLQIIAFGDQWRFDTAAEAIKMGAREVWDFRNCVGQLGKAIRAVLNNESPEPLLLYAMIPGSILSRLEAEELSVLSFIVQGQTAKQAGASLDVSVRTIHYRKKSIFSKLGVSDRLELIELIRRVEDSDGRST